MAVNATLQNGIRSSKSYALTSLGGTTSVSHNLISSITLNGNSTPVVDDSWGARMSLTAGALTLALDALPQTGQTALDLTNKVIYAVTIHVLAGSAAMTFEGAASNPYELFGLSTDEMTIDPDGWITLFSPTGFGTVTGSTSDIDVAGTGTDSFDITLLAGTP